MNRYTLLLISLTHFQILSRTYTHVNQESYKIAQEIPVNIHIRRLFEIRIIPLAIEARNASEFGRQNVHLR